MYETTFDQFAPALKRLGSQGQHAPEFSLGKDGPYELRYIPFEYLNRDARLVIVGITPGPNQIELAYDAAQSLLMSGCSQENGELWRPGDAPESVADATPLSLQQALGH
jgi:hypothetical protein